MPPAASDGRITAACAFMPQQQRSAPTPSAALSADLSSARRGGEPTSQCASPATIAAITAMPPAASDGRITAACEFMPQQHRSAPTPQCLKVGVCVSGTVQFFSWAQCRCDSMICVIAEMPSVASYGMMFAASAFVPPQRCTGRTTHMPSAENLSDWLTKPLKLAVFLPMRARMMHFARMPVASP